MLFVVFMATVAMLVNIVAGVSLLTVPSRRQFAPYFFLVYPCAYVAVFAGSIPTSFALDRLNFAFRYSSPDWLPISATVFALGIAALISSGFVGAVIGFAISNRIWWRYFSRSACPSNRGVLAITPPVRAAVRLLLDFLRSHLTKRSSRAPQW